MHPTVQFILTQLTRDELRAIERAARERHQPAVLTAVLVELALRNELTEVELLERAGQLTIEDALDARRSCSEPGEEAGL